MVNFGKYSIPRPATLYWLRPGHLLKEPMETNKIRKRATSFDHKILVVETCGHTTLKKEGKLHIMQKTDRASGFALG